MEQIDPRHLLAKIAKILNQLKIPYLVTGGMAVFVWGRPRFTADIDIVIELTLKDINKFIPALLSFHKASYLDKDTVVDAINRYGEFNFIDGESGIKVDFWIVKKEPFNLSRFQRRIAKTILKEKAYFISPEDLILSKLLWYKIAETSRHLEDIESVLKISGPKIDMKYLKKWAEKLSVAKMLDKLL